MEFRITFEREDYYRTYYKDLELKTDIYDKNNCRLWYKEVQNEQN